MFFFLRRQCLSPHPPRRRLLLTPDLADSRSAYVFFLFGLCFVRQSFLRLDRHVVLKSTLLLLPLYSPIHGSRFERVTNFTYYRSCPESLGVGCCKNSSQESDHFRDAPRALSPRPSPQVPPPPCHLSRTLSADSHCCACACACSGMGNAA